MDPDETQSPSGGIAVRPEGDGSVVSLRGEIDGSLRDAASSSMVQVIARGGPVVIETAEVTFIDSTGLAFLVQLYRLGEETGQPCSLRNPAPMVLKLLDVLGMGDRMAIDRAGDLDELGAPDDDLRPAPARS